MTIVDGWAVVTQPERLRGEACGRNRHAGYSTGTAERIRFTQAHLDALDIDPGDEVLVGLIPEASALAITNPNVVLRLAPTHVLNLFMQGASS